MLKLPTTLLKNLFISPRLITISNKAFFAKEGKQGKKGGKQQKKQQAPAKSEQQLAQQKLEPYQRLINYFTPLQPGLSPSEEKALNQNFEDLPQEQKQMLDQLANKIAELNTSLFYNFVFKREGLGTTQAYVVGSGQYNQNQIKEGIKVLRKDI